MQPSPPASTARACLGALLVLALAGPLSLSACSRCAAVQDRFELETRDVLARTGPGGRVDTGLNDHLQLLLAPEDVERVADGVLRAEWLRGASDRAVVQTPAGEALLEVELVPRISGFQPYPPQDEHSASLEVELVVYARLTGPEVRERVTLNVEGQVDVALALENRPAPALVLDASRASLEVEPPDLDALPEEARGAAETLTRSLFEEVLRQAPRTLDVVRFGPVNLGARRMPLTASSLRVYPSGALRIGFVSELRVAGEAMPPLEGPISTAWRVHEDALRAAMEYLAAIGAAPRRFDQSGRASVTGPFASTDVRLTWSPSTVRADFDWWCLAGRRCRVESASLVLEQEWSEAAPRIALVRTDDASSAPGRFRGVAASASGVVEGFAAGAALELASGAALALRPRSGSVAQGAWLVFGPLAEPEG